MPLVDISQLRPQIEASCMAINFRLRTCSLLVADGGLLVICEYFAVDPMIGLTCPAYRACHQL